MQMNIGGKKVSSSDGKVSNVFNPATQELLDTVPVATEEDIERCLDIAQDGKKLWAGTPLVERSKILLKYASLLESHKKNWRHYRARIWESRSRSVSVKSIRPLCCSRVLWKGLNTYTERLCPSLNLAQRKTYSSPEGALRRHCLYSPL